MSASKMAKIFSIVLISLAVLAWGGYFIIWVLILGGAMIGNM
jgi:bacteriorhodopsin